MASYCLVGQRDSLDLAWLRNGTASSLPGWVTGYCGFGVVHPDSRLHNGAPRYGTGISICNWTSGISVRNRYMQLPLHAPPTLLKSVFSSMYLYIQVMRNIVQRSRTVFWSGQVVKGINLMGQNLDPGCKWDYRRQCCSPSPPPCIASSNTLLWFHQWQMSGTHKFIREKIYVLLQV